MSNSNFTDIDPLAQNYATIIKSNIIPQIPYGPNNTYPYANSHPSQFFLSQIFTELKEVHERINVNDKGNFQPKKISNQN